MKHSIHNKRSQKLFVDSCSLIDCRQANNQRPTTNNYIRAAYLFTLLALLSCSKKGTGSAVAENPSPVTQENIVSLTEEQFKSVGIELGRTEERQLNGAVSVTGKLDVPPQNVVNITAPFGGFLRSTSLLQGMHLVKGQIIAVIENPEYIQLQQDFLDTKSQVQFLEAENLRQEELAKESVNSQKTLQKSRADLESMKAKNNGLRAKLKMLNIDADQLGPGAIRSTIELHSPINGYVTQVNSTIGAFVTPTEVMFRIVDTEHLHAELTAFERDIPRIQVGQKIRFTLANETSERTAKVFLIGREITADRTVRIHGHLDREDFNLIPGMYLKAQIETGGHSVPSLPEEAVVSFEDKNYVFVSKVGEAHQFEMVEVSTGIRDSGSVEVHLPEQFDKQSTIVVKGAFNLLSKLKNSASIE